MKKKICPHGLPKWSCKICISAYAKAYRKILRGKMIRNKIQARYARTPKGKITQRKARKKYMKTEKGKLSQRKSNKIQREKAKMRRSALVLLR